MRGLRRCFCEGFVVTAFSCAVLTGCGKGGTAAGAPAGRRADPVPVSLAPVEVRSAQRWIEVTGTLFGDEETTISAKQSGRVVAVHRDVGDQAPPGEALAQIERREYELELNERRAAVGAALSRIGLTELPAEAEGFDPARVPAVVRAVAQAANAEAKLKRAAEVAGGVGSGRSPLSAQEFADIRTASDVAASEVEVALLTARSTLAEARTLAAEAEVAAQRLEETTVRAPEAGGSGDGDGVRYTVAERLVSVGEYVAAGREMFRLVAADRIKFRADVPERFAGEAVVGLRVLVSVDAYPEPFEGRIARVSPRINPASRSFQIEVHVPNPDGRLKPGAFARGRVATRAEEGVTYVPATAVVTFAGVQKVFSVRDGKAVEHRIHTGDRGGGMVEIRGDALPSGSVVTSGAAGLADGTPVQAAPASTPGG